MLQYFRNNYPKYLSTKYYKVVFEIAKGFLNHPNRGGGISRDEGDRYESVIHSFILKSRSLKPSCQIRKNKYDYKKFSTFLELNEKYAFEIHMANVDTT